MREFREPISSAKRQEVLDLVQDLVARAPGSRPVLAEEFVLEPPQAEVLDRADIATPEGNVRLHLCRPDWRPPFEWLAEITSDLPGADYLKHYLVRDQDIVLAHRRDLRVIDDDEAEVLLGDLQAAARALDDLG